LQFVHFPKKALPRSFLPQLEEAHSAPTLASWFVPGILTVFGAVRIMDGNGGLRLFGNHVSPSCSQQCL
jgi:hypothetical protein